MNDQMNGWCFKCMYMYTCNQQHADALAFTQCIFLNCLHVRAVFWLKNRREKSSSQSFSQRVEKD